ncbi:MAG: tetratricopeptide repeat protein [Immundisolibacter sp.]
MAFAYCPGLSGPWLFDDYSNVRENAFLRVGTLDWQSLRGAASSMSAGPLGRPIAYMSFALDHYLHGDATPYPYKLANVLIHGLNALLVAALLGTVLGRLAARQALPARLTAPAALAITALWAVHPIQISSVLYVVQRMTSLSATFTLAALLCWLRARDGVARRFATPAIELAPLAMVGWLLAGGLFWTLGLFTKETAVVLPLYALLLDRVLFPEAPWWQRWQRIPAGARLALLTSGLVLVFGLAAWHYAPGYAGRPFTLAERVLTQARVLWFYASLAALPRIDAFGLHHDDIALSTGLLTPWTTLPALLGLAAVGLLAWRCTDRRPLIGLGIAWFLAGHALESTVVPLEIAHEHRNYLPLLGLLLAAAGGLLAVRWPRRRLAAVAATVSAVLAATTALRADQWGDELGMSRYEVRHHPGSAQARNNLAADLVWRGQYPEARQHLLAAMDIAPWEAGYPMNLVGAYRVEHIDPPPALNAEILKRIRSQPLSAFASNTLQRYSECLPKGCAYMAADVTRWLEAYLASDQPTFDRSYVYFLLGRAYREQGRIQDALNAFQRAHDLDPRYLHPLFEQANILLALRQWDAATQVLDSIRAANERAYQRLDRQIAQLDAAIATGRTAESAEHKPAAAP